MAINSMRYKIILDGKESGNGFVGLEEMLCKEGYLVAPFHQWYVYRIEYLSGYDMILKPMCDSAISVHNGMLKKK